MLVTEGREGGVFQILECESRVQRLVMPLRSGSFWATGSRPLWLESPELRGKQKGILYYVLAILFLKALAIYSMF